ncbi:MAG: DUF2332 domain-containing protein [Acidimicrobiia bacterium]|nr:DUF2332 domain-containing protein [Acidimicrobiia bacterium]
MDRHHRRPLDERFRRFAHHVAESPRYRRICLTVADDADLLAVCDAAPATQPVPNLLLAAVHDLLLEGIDHPLAAWYPTVGGTRGPDGVEAPFRDAVLAHRDRVRAVLATRTVQTNEVRRSVGWYAALAPLRRPLALVEVGASGGLNLRWDRYGYRFGAIAAGDPDAGLVLTTGVRGAHPPVPPSPPPVVFRRGIDRAPVDVSDPAGARWLRALVWPEQTDRMERLDLALDAARSEPVRIDAGDALDLVGAAVAEAPEEADLVVMHSFVLNQTTTTWREAFASTLDDIGLHRPVHRASIEWLEPDDGPMLDLTLHHGGERRRTRLAAIHHHGAWIAWR